MQVSEDGVTEVMGTRPASRTVFLCSVHDLPQKSAFQTSIRRRWHHTKNHMLAPSAVAVNRYARGTWGIGGFGPILLGCCIVRSAADSRCPIERAYARLTH